MTLIKCKECGKEISDKADSCPICGCPIDNNTTLKCEECGNDLEKYDETCPKCGCPVTKKKINNSPETNDNGKTLCLTGMIVGIISLFIDLYGLVATAGLTISIVAISKKPSEKNRKKAIAGIVCSGIELLVKVVALIILVADNMPY